MASEDTQNVGNMNGTAAQPGNPLGSNRREVRALYSAHGMLMRLSTLYFC